MRIKLASTIGVSAGTGRGIWIYDVARGFGARFTSDAAAERDPVWFPDGKMIVFNSNRRGHFDIYQGPSDGSREAELVYADNLEKYPSSISPDGKVLLYYTLDDPKGMNYSWVLPLKGERKPFRLTRDTFQGGVFQYNAHFSPDGRWIGYCSNESGRPEVYVIPFPGPGGKVRVSEAGGLNPRWRRDGKELFYRVGDRLISVGVEVNGSSFVVGRTMSLFAGVPLAPGYSYDVSADGQRFLVISAPEQSATEPLTLVQNWTAGLRR